MWNKIKNFFVQLVVLLPIALGMGACCFFFAVGIITLGHESNQDLSPVLAVVVLVGLLALLVGLVYLFRLVRYGRYPDVAFFWDLLVSPLRAILQPIALIIAFIALFSGVDSDYREDDGLASFLLLFTPD